MGLKAQKRVLSSKNKECYVVLKHAYLYFYESYVSYMANAAELHKCWLKVLYMLYILCM